MFVVLLKFSANKAKAGQFMDGHNAWLRQGFAEGIFLLAGSIKPGLGGAILAHGATAEDLQPRMWCRRKFSRSRRQRWTSA
jgi:uncharacterized protein YciI